MLNSLLEKTGVNWSTLPRTFFRFAIDRWFLRFILTSDQRKEIIASKDPVRYGSFFLAFDEIQQGQLPGVMAECGVYRGDLSKYLHKMAPERPLYLFDTFAGFDSRDMAGIEDQRFRDTSVEGVLRNIGDSEHIVVRQGYFPETARGLEEERFVLVVLDFDKYAPTMEGLRFFYSRMTPGGYIFVHDVNSPESDWACSHALREFLADKPEKIITIPDAWGSALFRKV